MTCRRYILDISVYKNNIYLFFCSLKHLFFPSIYNLKVSYSKPFGEETFQNFGGDFCNDSICSHGSVGTGYTRWVTIISAEIEIDETSSNSSLVFAHIPLRKVYISPFYGLTNVAHWIL